MAFQGKYLIRSKTVINIQTIEQVEICNCLGLDLSHNHDEDKEIIQISAYVQNHKANYRKQILE
jgi:hypothetical protein